MNTRALLTLATLAAATSPDLGKGALDRLKAGVREGCARDPMGSVLATVLGGAWLFYKAEHGRNPKVQSYYDALVYVSTNLSVGYSDIFAKTSRGKAIGAALMTYGPAMAAKILDAPSGPSTATGAAGNATTGNGTAGNGSGPNGNGTSKNGASKNGGSGNGEGSFTSRDVVERLDRILVLLEGLREGDRTRTVPLRT